MKKYLSIIISIILVFTLCACTNDTVTPTESTPESETSADNNLNYSATDILGTWVCEDINKDVYFIFEENGDAYAKWGTCTVYGYFDYYEDENVYDIDINNFLYNEYECHLGEDVMTLISEDSRYTFEKAQMPQIEITFDEILAVDDKVVGNWQCETNYECYQFNDDGTAIITDLYNYSTIDCKYTCIDGVISLYYMASETKSGSKELDYSFTDDGLLKLDDYEYLKVS